MGFSRSLLAIILLMAWYGVCFGAVYRVGDSNGWTNEANINYKSWSSSKEFHVGDTIVFNYDAGKDNVLRVSHKSYQTCNVTNPIRRISSGHDSITIRKPHTHLFFISGIPSHCEAGQKVDVRVVSNNSGHSKIPTPSTPTPSPASAPNGNSLAPAPAPNAGSTLVSNIQLFVATAVLALFAF